MKRHLTILAVVACSLGAAVLSAQAPTAGGPQKIESAKLPNAFRLTDKVLSGGQPDGEAAFKELKELGVRTVISVDGAKPEVALAKKYGLRYVHLPHGYDGIPDARLVELAKAVRELPGPIYIHCHHGKHRSPAAAAAACVSAGMMTNEQALAVLAAAGTSPDYRGLFQSVREARPMDPKTLDAAKVEYHEVAPVPPLADAMVGVEHTHDNLKTVAAVGWQPTQEHADIDPPHEALLLREHFTELLRTEEVQKQPAEFRMILEQSEADAKVLEERLRAKTSDVLELNEVFGRITADCASCHKTFRDVPLKEKNVAPGGGTK